MGMKKLVHTGNMRFKRFKGYNMPKPQKKDYYKKIK